MRKNRPCGVLTTTQEESNSVPQLYGSSTTTTTGTGGSTIDDPKKGCTVMKTGKTLIVYRISSAKHGYDHYPLLRIDNTYVLTCMQRVTY